MSVDPDKAFALQMQNDLLRSFFGAQFSRVDYNVSILWFFVGIRNAGKLLQNAGAGFRVKTFPVALFTGLDRGCDMYQDETTNRFDHSTHRFAGRVVRSDRGADRDPAVLGNLRSDITNTPDVNVAMFLREAEFGRKMLAHQISVQQRDRTAACL